MALGASWGLPGLSWRFWCKLERGAQNRPFHYFFTFFIDGTAALDVLGGSGGTLGPLGPLTWGALGPGQWRGGPWPGALGPWCGGLGWRGVCGNRPAWALWSRNPSRQGQGLGFRV